MAGRKPKPTRLKELAGWPGHHPKPKGEPRPPTELGDCPGHLRGLARVEWDRLAPQLKTLGLLTVVDRAALEAYCVAYARWREAESHLRDPKQQVGENRFGEEVPSPWFTVAQKTMDIMRRLAVEFGFTPSSRSKVTATPPAGDPDAEFFQGGPRKIGVVG